MLIDDRKQTQPDEFWSVYRVPVCSASDDWWDDASERVHKESKTYTEKFSSCGWNPLYRINRMPDYDAIHMHLTYCKYNWKK